jgi:hypothetical protein
VLWREIKLLFGKIGDIEILINCLIIISLTIQLRIEEISELIKVKAKRKTEKIGGKIR